MAINNSKIFSDRMKKIQKSIDKGIEKSLRVLVKAIPNQITKRTRLGGGVISNDPDGFGGKRIKLDSLSPKYKKTRAYHRKRLHKNTSPNKSNLTATGQLLDSMKSKITRSSIVTRATGSRTRELTGSRPRIGNEKLRGYVEKTRPFNALSDAEVNKFERQARKIIQSEIKKLLG